MRNAATKADIDRLDKKIDDSIARLEMKIDQKIDYAIEHLTDVINKFAAHVDERFDRLESRVENLEIRMTSVEGELRYQNKRYDRLVEAINT